MDPRCSVGRGIEMAAIVGGLALGCANAEVTQGRDTDDPVVPTSSTSSDTTSSSSQTSSPGTNTMSSTGPSSSSSDGTGTSSTSSDTNETSTTTDATSGSTTGGGGFACADGLLGGNLPEVQTAPLSSADGDDFQASASCTDGTGGYDVAFEWTPPGAGSYVLGTLASDFDTVLAVYDACNGSEIACNDDVAAETLTSVVQVTLGEGETVLIVVDGYDASAVGTYELAIENG